MCDLGTALMITQGAASVASGVSGARATNSAARSTYASALASQANQNTGLDRRYIEQSDSLNTQGYDAAISAAAAAASARNSGASGGIAGRTISALVSEQARLGAQNRSRIQGSKDNARVSLQADKKAVQVQTEGRIEATPRGSYGIADLLIQGAQTGIGVMTGMKADARHKEQLELIARGG